MTKRVKTLLIVIISLLFINLFYISQISAADTPATTEQAKISLFKQVISIFSKNENSPAQGSSVQNAEKSKWEAIYVAKIDKQIADANAQIAILEKQKNDLREKSIKEGWLAERLVAEEIVIEQKIRDQQSSVKISTDKKIILNTFLILWLLIKFILIPIMLVYLIRNYLLILLANLIDSGFKTSFMKSLIKTITLGDNWFGFFVWFIGMEVVYVAFLKGSWIEENMGMFLLWLTINIMSLFSLNVHEPTQIALATLIGTVIIFLAISGLYLLLKGATTKLKKERRDMASQKLGVEIGALKETAEAAITKRG